MTHSSLENQYQLYMRDVDGTTYAYRVLKNPPLKNEDDVIVAAEQAVAHMLPEHVLRTTTGPLFQRLNLAMQLAVKRQDTHDLTHREEEDGDEEDEGEPPRLHNVFINAVMTGEPWKLLFLHYYIFHYEPTVHPMMRIKNISMKLPNVGATIFILSMLHSGLPDTVEQHIMDTPTGAAITAAAACLHGTVNLGKIPEARHIFKFNPGLDAILLLERPLCDSPVFLDLLRVSTVHWGDPGDIRECFVFRLCLAFAHAILLKKGVWEEETTQGRAFVCHYNLSHEHLQNFMLSGLERRSVMTWIGGDRLLCETIGMACCLGMITSSTMVDLTLKIGGSPSATEIFALCQTKA